MARQRRLIQPLSLIHIISRFLNGEHILNTARERTEYLRRAAKAFGDSDWALLAYALLGTHTHLAAVAGEAPFHEISRPLHSGFAGWLNPRRGRLGPVLAARPSTYEVAPKGAGRLIAYLHNNPPRAGVVASARESTWTSHLAYLGRVPCPGWLHVEAGLRLCGFARSNAGRRGFDAAPSLH